MLEKPKLISYLGNFIAMQFSHFLIFCQLLSLFTLICYLEHSQLKDPFNEEFVHFHPWYFRFENLRIDQQNKFCQAFLVNLRDNFKNNAVINDIVCGHIFSEVARGKYIFTPERSC
jgi:hypothetical protein